jgi:hypothetical protein
MLFDLQSPRRRAAIKIVYGALAVLFLVGFVGFGVGSPGVSGILDSLTGNGSGGGGNPFESDIEAAQAKLAKNPQDQQALVDLVTLNIQGSHSGVSQDPNTGQVSVSSDAVSGYNAAADAWNRYLALHPQQPDFGAAILMAGAFFTLAQAATTPSDYQIQIDSAAAAQRVASEQQPSGNTLGQLAIYLYLAGKPDQGDQAANQAIAKTPKASQAANRKALQHYKQLGERIQKRIEAQQKASGSTGGGQNPLAQSGGAGGLSAGGLSGGG